MTTLVTGASGGFGRLFTAWLQQESSGPLVRTSRVRERKENWLDCDLTDAAAVRRLIQRVRPRLVYHLAGSFSREFGAGCAVNALSARYLLEAVLEEVPSARIVLMGSAAEYGVLAREDNPVREDHVLSPVSMYGVTKALQTHFASLYAFQRGADVVVARMFNLLAPGLSERLFVGRVERLIASYRRGEIATIDVGNLDHQRDYVPAEAASEQLRQIAERGQRGRVYHIGSGEPIRMRVLLQTMLDAGGVPVSAVREAQEGTGRSGYDPPIIYADMRRTRGLMNGADQS